MTTPASLIAVVDGQEVEGRIVSLLPNDIEVEIITPFQGAKKGLHVPHFAMHRMNWLCSEDGEITERGLGKAKQLLAELYEAAIVAKHGQGGQQSDTM